MDTESGSAFAKVAGDTELYGPSPGLSRYPLGNTTELVYCPYDRARHVLSADEGAVLMQCQGFAPLSEHARRALSGDKLDESFVQSCLQRLVATGVLVAQQRLVAVCLAHNAGNPPPTQITSLSVPTRNRPELLARCVESYAQCAKDYSRNINFIIADSSDDDSVCRRNVEALTALRTRYGVGISYFGDAEKRDFARRLTARGVDRQCIDFALLNPEDLPCDTGANRNALLLSTVGECTVQVDDDSVCRVIPWAEGSEGIRFTSNFDPTEFAFLDEEEADLAYRFESKDFFALHEMLLGRSPGELIERYGLGSPTFERPTATFLRRVERGGTRVGVTALGAAGDSAMASSTYFLMLEGRSRASLTRSEAVYCNGLSRHRLIRAARQLTVVGEHANCMALNLGFDNRRLLPPFMPVQRAQDEMFAAILRASAEGSAFGFVPWALAHEPVPRLRQSAFGGLTRLSSISLIAAMVRSFSPIEAKGAEWNLRALGVRLCDWGHAPVEDLLEFERVLAWREVSRQVAMLEGLLQKYQGVPQFWAADAKNHIASLKASAANQNYVVPLDLGAQFDTAIRRVQRLASRLGELLQIWPAVRQAANQERISGRPIGRQL